MPGTKISLRRAVIVAALVAGALAATAQPAVTPCAEAFNARGIAISGHHPHDAFFSAGAVVKHISSVHPGAGPCGFGPLAADIALGAGLTVSNGLALDRSGNLFVAAGHGAATTILKIAPPYTGTPTVFFDKGKNLAGLAIRGHVLYAADPGSGTILRFNLKDKPGTFTVFASVPGVFGIFAAGRDDLFVTSNAGLGGSNDVRRVTRDGVSAIATGFSFPEGITGDHKNLYIASSAVVFSVPRTGGTPALYARGPIQFSHAMFLFEDAGYVADSNGPGGHVFKFALADDRKRN